MTDDLVAIFDPHGRILAESIGNSRRNARRSVAASHGVKWHQLWEAGYRVHKLTANDLMRAVIVERLPR